MDSFLGSLRECWWPSETSYDPLPSYLQHLPLTPETASGMNSTLDTALSSRPWRVDLKFTSIEEDTKDLTSNIDLDAKWAADLDVQTADIVGLMREGLHVSQHDVQVSFIFYWSICPVTKKRVFFLKCALVHPKWSGRLKVRTMNFSIIMGFQLYHLSADKVFYANVKNVNGINSKTVYRYEVRNSIPVRMNLVLNDKPLPGLWTWPKKEPASREEEDCSQGKVQ